MFLGRGLVKSWISFLPRLSLALSTGTPRMSQSWPSAPGRPCAKARTIVSLMRSMGTRTLCRASTVRSKALLWITTLSASSTSSCR